MEEIIRQYEDKLFRTAIAIMGGKADAEDVVQDVFISANQNQEKFDGKNLSAWLYKITYNKSINKLKRRKVLFFSDVGEITVEGFSGSDDIFQILKILKPIDRALLYGRIMEGYSYEELSEQMGESPANLRKRYERAKLKVAEHLDFNYESKGALDIV